MVRHRKWTASVILTAIALGAAGAAALWHVDAGRQWGLSERDYAQVERGMSKGQVIEILGNPTERTVKDPDHPGVRLHISNRSGQDLSAAVEVWMWKRGLQTMRVVFDAEGHVLHKWVDY